MEKKELNIIKELNQKGLKATVDKYRLELRESEHRIILHYDQLKTPKNPTTNECRGVIIKRVGEKFEAMSMPLYRFGEYKAGHKGVLDWESAVGEDKGDGAMIQRYYDNVINEWVVGTKKSGYAIDKVSYRDKHNHSILVEQDFDYTHLFNRIAKENHVDLTHSKKGVTYVFECISADNKVINTYQQGNIVLLAAREMDTLQEYDTDELDMIAMVFNCDRPKRYPYKGKDEILKSLHNVKLGDQNFEGYVVVDKHGNRLKIKSNSYVIHHQWNETYKTITSKWRFVDAIRAGEEETIIGYFPLLAKEIYPLKTPYDVLIARCEQVFDQLKEKVANLDGKEMCDKDFYTFAQKATDHKKHLRVFLGPIHSLRLNPESVFKDAIWEMKAKNILKALKIEIKNHKNAI